MSQWTSLSPSAGFSVNDKGLPKEPPDVLAAAAVVSAAVAATAATAAATAAEAAEAVIAAAAEQNDNNQNDPDAAIVTPAHNIFLSSRRCIL